MKSIKELLKIKNDKYVVRYCVRESNSYNIVKNVLITPTTKEIKYDKDNTFIVDIENPTYRDGNTRYYCIDLNSKQIHFEQLDTKEFVSSRINSLILVDKTIEQLAKATTTPIKSNYDYKALIIGIIIGALLGFIIKIFVPIGVV